MQRPYQRVNHVLLAGCFCLLSTFHVRCAVWRSGLQITGVTGCYYTETTKAAKQRNIGRTGQTAATTGAFFYAKSHHKIASKIVLKVAFGKSTKGEQSIQFDDGNTPTSGYCMSTINKQSVWEYMPSLLGKEWQKVALRGWGQISTASPSTVVEPSQNTPVAWQR